MWISRKDFDRLVARVDRMEKDKASAYIPIPSRQSFMAGVWYSCETMTVHEAIDALASYLGVEFNKSLSTAASVTARKKK